MTAGEAVVRAARSWIGTPYVHRASVKGAGCDCLGLVLGVRRETGGPYDVSLPAYGREAEYPDLQAGFDAHFCRAAFAGEAAGQILLFAWRTGAAAGHCGIRSGPDHFIHCYGGRAVAETALTRWWQRRLIAQYVFPEKE